MGQYYKPVNLIKKQWLLSHDYGGKHGFQGLKLMEHSYIGNYFVQAIENLLIPGGAWHKDKIVWAGDYADEEFGSKDNIYCIIDKKKKIKPKSKKLLKKYKYLCNHTMKVYIDRTKIKDIEGEKDFKINPLPLLTCEGNGRGGGDFIGEDNRIGMWARHRISIESKVPKYFIEVSGNFVEER